MTPQPFSWASLHLHLCSSEAQPTPLPSPDTGQETSEGSCPGWGVERIGGHGGRRTRRAVKVTWGSLPPSALVGKAGLGRWQDTSCRNGLSGGGPRGTHAWMASVTEPIWLTFSSRQLQAFSSTARSIRLGLVTVRSSPTIWIPTLAVELGPGRPIVLVKGVLNGDHLLGER